MSRPLFITLEGGEGVGKSTALQVVASWLQKHQYPIVLTREPGGTPLAEKIRALLLATDAEPWSNMAELLMVFAARAQHLEQVIKPALASGTTVVSDRFTDATYAYQGFGRGLDCDHIATLETLVQQGLQPDLTLLLDAPVAVGMARAKQRAELDRFEQEQLSFFEAIRAGYQWRAQQQPQRFVLIDASQALEAVSTAIEQALTQRLQPLRGLYGE